jgi:predicted kinase
MRKWMRERVKRRKKAPEKGTAEPAQAPLQPAFYDVEPPAAEPPAKITQPEAAPEPADEEPQEMSEPQASQPGQQAEPGDGRPRRRRRRGRGGRGRGGTEAAPRAATGEPAVQPALAEPAAVHKAVPTPAAPRTPATSTPRAPRGVVVLAIGLPGSGKSSWFKRHNLAPLSSDMLRALLFDDPTEQRFQDLVFSNLRSMLKARLVARRPMNYVDATNLSPHERQGWIKLAKDFQYEVHAVFFDVPLEVCLQRNQKRQRTVSEDVMRRMAGKLKAPTFEEGFAKITVVRVKAKE